MIWSNPHEKCDAKSHQGRMNVKEDRLSSLPDELIHKILSFISIRQAIRTSVLSSRWRSIWTSMPYLNFSSEIFYAHNVSSVLSHRNNQIPVSSVKLGRVDFSSIKPILKYTFSHNVQQLTVTCELNAYVGFPLSIFNSRSLKHLTLKMNGASFASSSVIATPAWDLPALTTLHIHNIKLPDECTLLFSKCTNLNYLCISRCRATGTNVLNICHPRLSNLTLQHTNWSVEAFNVVAPQLKNLTIIDCYGKHLISALGLTSLFMKGDSPLHLSINGLCCLEKVDLCISDPLLEDAHKIVSLLQQLLNVKLLTLNLQILELLSSSVGLMSHQPSLSLNLKITKFSKSGSAMVYLEVQEHKKATMSTETKSNELDTSPSSIFTMVSCEEIRVMRDIVTARTLVAEVGLLLEQWKALSYSNNDHMEQANSPMDSGKRKMHEHVKAEVKKQWAQSTFEMQWHFEEIMAQIKQGKIEGLLTKRPTSETCHMITWLQRIEGLLIELPASKRDVMQATFSSVCKEAAIVANDVLDSMRIRYNKKRRGVNV